MATFLEVDDLKGRDLEAVLQGWSDGSAPLTIDGIRWLAVGQNASHTFYLGLDALGALYKSAVDWYDVDVGYHAPGVETSVSFEREINRHRRPVKDGARVYLGR